MSDSIIQQARELARFEREEEDRAFRLRAQSYGVDADASTPPAPTKAGKSVLEQALDAYEARTAGLDHILGTSPAPAPKAAPTAPTKAGKSALERALDLHDSRKVFPC